MTASLERRAGRESRPLSGVPLGREQGPALRSPSILARGRQARRIRVRCMPSRLHRENAVQRTVSVAACVLVWCASVGAVRGADATTPGNVTTPYPTLINLAVEWQIEGDDNLNGVVTVRYRAVGQPDWRDAMPLRRVPAGKTSPNL